MNAMVGGIDIGGTKIRWVAMHGPRVIWAEEVPTPRGGSAFIAALRTIVLRLHARGIERIGIGSAGVVSGTTIISSRNIPFLHQLDLASIVPKGVSIRLDNDARCFARAESELGRGARAKRLFALVLGTGAGRAMAMNGVVKPIASFSHAETWESSYQKLAKGPAWPLAGFLGEKLAALIAEMNPDRVVIGGGAMRKKNFFALLRRELKRRGVRVTVCRSRFRQNGPAIGAALQVS